MTSTIGTEMTRRAPTPDRGLLSSVRAGDQAAREQLARQLGNTAYVFALQLTGGTENAKDVAQDSVMRFFQHLDRFDSSRPVEPWIYQIVRNRVRDMHRRDQHRRHESLDAWLEIDRPETADPNADPAADVEQTDLRRRVWQAISQLSDQQREIIVLRDYNDLSYKEIADVLQIPQGTVMSRLHTARQRLREIVMDKASGLGLEDQ